MSLPATSEHTSVGAHLDALCATRDRAVGGPGNHAAVAYAREIFRRSGFVVDEVDFDTMLWDRGPAALVTEGRTWSLEAAPFTAPCDVRAELVEVATLEELAQSTCEGKVLLVHGELAREQLVPKAFVFVEAPEHRRILELLEARQPAAVVAATGRGGGFSGGVRPFPLIEDGDVDIPNAAIDERWLEGLRASVGRPVHVTIASGRRRGRATQLFASTGATSGGTVSVLAHIDSKSGSPGALDNAAGVAALLRIAELLGDRPATGGVELIPINGEDHYDVPGERLYLQRRDGRWAGLLLGVNIDGIGSRHAPVAVSTYGCPSDVEAAVGIAREATPGVVGGDPWYEGDHGLFLMHGRPAVALTSADAATLTATVTHTAADRRELVDEDAVERTARFVDRVIRGLQAPA